jgi:hypothetical protein
MGVTIFADDEDEEIAQARICMTLAQRTGNPTCLAVASYSLGWALRNRHPDEAIVALDGYVALPGHAASGSALAHALAVGPRVAASQGRRRGRRRRSEDQAQARAGGVHSTRHWTYLTQSLDVAVDIFCYLGEARTGAVGNDTFIWP